MSSPVNSSCSDIALVTPDDDASLANGSKHPIGFAIATTLGDVAVVTADGRTITLPSALFTIGDRFPLCVSKVLATGTTAVGIYVFYGVG